MTNASDSRLGRRRLVFALSCLGIGISSCASDPVIVEVAFPSESAFLQSTSARLTVYGAPDAFDSVCAELLAGTRRDLSIENDSGLTDVCALRGGGVRFDDVSAGPKAFVVQIRNASDAIILEGCTVREAYTESEPIVVSITATDFYDEQSPLSCDSVEQKCAGACP